MRIAAIVGWLLLPVLFGAYHYGPGQQQLVLDDVGRLLRDAQQHVEDEQWGAAVACYDDALAVLPGDRVSETRRVRLERAKAQMMVKQLPVAHRELKMLAEEMVDDREANPELLAEVRRSLAHSQYYMTWLMRLEGLGRDQWEPEIESSRQIFRLLAEEAQKQGNTSAAQVARQDLESAIRLARMDLGELQGLPLPSQ